MSNLDVSTLSILSMAHTDFSSALPTISRPKGSLSVDNRVTVYANHDGLFHETKGLTNEINDAFNCSLGIAISEEDTPSLYMLLRRILADAGLAPYSAKNAYQRERPFMVNGEPTCTPDEDEMLRKDGSYPSGHTAVGWGWALILSELSPERAEVILARGRSFGESRNVCNVHWYSDVVAGRLAE